MHSLFTDNDRFCYIILSFDVLYLEGNGTFKLIIVIGQAAFHQNNTVWVSDADVYTVFNNHVSCQKLHMLVLYTSISHVPKNINKLSLDVFLLMPHFSPDCLTACRAAALLWQLPFPAQSALTPARGTWEHSNESTGRKLIVTSIATMAKLDFFYHFKSKIAAVSMRWSSVRGGLIDASGWNSNRYKRPIRHGVASSSPACRNNVTGTYTETRWL